MISNKLAKEFTRQIAEKYLRRWMKEKGFFIDHYFAPSRHFLKLEWHYWCYNESPFWSVSLYMRGCEINFGRYGLHIHEDGEVLLIGKMPDEE